MIQQRYLTPRWLIACIVFMNMFIPLSIDLYLPALPEMGHYFQAGEMLVNLTLVAFFLFFAVGIILFGPLCDKYGRRPVLIGGTMLYTASSLLCAAAPSIYVLIAGRILQALGAGCMITVATALIKDCFAGKNMTRILAVTQALNVIAPMAAPILGGFLLTYTTWHGAFYLLTALGLVSLVMALLLTEPLAAEERSQVPIFKALGLLIAYTKHRQFMIILTMFSLLAAPYMAYLSISSFVYIQYFGLSAQTYSFYFAANSAAAVIGPIIYLHLVSHVSRKTLTKGCFFVTAVSSAAVLTSGHLSALGFLLSFLPFTITEAIIRPFTMDILLKSAKEDIGTASSLINFVPTLLGSLGMALSTLPWGNFITGLGSIMAGALFGALLLWRKAKL